MSVELRDGESLLPCPFCGSDQVWLKLEGRVVCQSCRAATAKVPLQYGGEWRERAVAAWNRRRGEIKMNPEYLARVHKELCGMALSLASVEEAARNDLGEPKDTIEAINFAIYRFIRRTSPFYQKEKDAKSPMAES